MNNQGIDRISELPEALIIQILSLLPTKVAVATSVLSKQWQSLWKMLPKLKFDSYHHSSELGTFSKNVCKALLSHKAPVLQSLHLEIRSERCNSMDTRILIGIAFARNVRKLVLHVETGEQFIFPKCFYNCETLETLELWSSSVLMDVPSSVCLNSLTTLDLNFVDFKDDESVLNLLSGCPKLENLVVHGISYCNVKTFIIAVPSLQRLSIFYYSGEPHTCWVINVPSLKYLTIVGVKSLDSCLIENVRELVEANLINVSADEIINEKLMGSLTSAKRLCLSVPPFKNKFPTGIIFYQLVYLELRTYRFEWWNLLNIMLDSSPKLQVLKLIGHLYGRNDLLPRGKWNQPKNVPQCLLFHLETFMWEGYELKQEDEIEAAKYILSNTNRLKRATFISSKDITRKRRVKILEDLNSVVRASNSCQILFK